MKIGILDGFTLFQSDIDWKFLKSFGDVIYFDRIENDQIPSELHDSTILITNKFVLNETNLAQFSYLKLIIVSATGYNCVDTNYCKSKGIQVANVPNYGTYSVAQHAMALLLNYTNAVEIHAQSVKDGEWVTCKDFSYQKKPLIELYGKTMGILGMGAIGSAFAKMCQSLGMKIIYAHTKNLHLPDLEYVSIEKLAQDSDFISLHCPLNAQTNQIINNKFLAHVKKNLVLINTSRGGLINSQDLADALNQDTISAALLDVLEVEPPTNADPLLKAKNCSITPHNAWISFEARSRIVQIVKNIIENYQIHLVCQLNVIN